MENPKKNWCWMFMAGEMDKDDIEYFLAIGALEFSYVDDDGDEVYRLTEKAKEIAPQLYEEQMKDFNAAIFSLWNKGVIDITFDNNGEPLIGISEDVYDMEISELLDEEERDILQEIVLAWNIKNNE
jgi:hypothetical protein